MSSSMFISISDDEISIGDYDYPGTPRSFSPAPNGLVGPNGPFNLGGVHPAQSWSYGYVNPDPIPSPPNVTTVQDLETTTMGLIGDHYILKGRVDLLEARNVDYKWKIGTFVAIGVAVVTIVAAVLRS